MDWLPASARARGQGLALMDDDAAWSYRALVRHVDAGARELSAAGLGPGSVLLWEARARCEAVGALHAAFRAGVTVAPYRSGLDRAARAALAERLGARAELVAGDAPRAADGLRSFRFDELARGPKQDAGTVVFDPERVATLMQTSGGGGAPKLVPLRWRQQLAGIEAVSRRLGLSAGDRWLACLPLHHVGGLAILLRSAVHGSSVCLHAGFDAQRVVAAFEEFAITHVSLVPTQLRRILRVLEALDRPRSTSLRCVLVGGAAAEPELLDRARRMGVPVVPTWGMTEAGSQLVTPSLDEAAAMNFLAVPGRIGRPLDGVEVRARFPGRREGELQVRAPSLFDAYLDGGGGPDETGWFATGDRGTVEDDGSIRILGRVSDRIISGGENVDPRAVERALLDADRVEDVCVLGLPDEEWGERVVAVAVSALDADALTRWARQHLEAHQRPRQWRLVERLPQTDSGKPDRRAMARLFDD